MFLFIIEMKYIAVSKTSCKIISVHNILQELRMINSDFIFSLLIDNNDMIVISKDEKITQNAHHIEICYHHIWNLIEKAVIDISHILLAQMTVDSFTKFLDTIKFDEFCDLIDIENCKWTQDSKPANQQTRRSVSQQARKLQIRIWGCKHTSSEKNTL